MSLRVFLNYRRADDPGHAGRLYDHLKAALPDGHVFMDIDGSSIPLGAKFSHVIDAQVRACDVLIAVVGPRWLSLLQGRTTTIPDYVVMEIESALQHGKPVVRNRSADRLWRCATVHA